MLKNFFRLSRCSRGFVGVASKLVPIALRREKKPLNFVLVFLVRNDVGREIVENLKNGMLKLPTRRLSARRQRSAICRFALAFMNNSTFSQENMIQKRNSEMANKHFAERLHLYTQTYFVNQLEPPVKMICCGHQNSSCRRSKSA